MSTPIPYSKEFLRSCASDSCPCCVGGGQALGFRLAGKLCPCVHRCAFCEAPLPVDDEHFDEGRPLTLEGLPACPACRAE